jgi:RNA polymerase sigma-70 factor (ECF subfamily)
MPSRSRKPPPKPLGSDEGPAAELRARLEVIFKEHFQGLLRVALGTGRPLERSKELIQETFVRVYKTRDAHQVENLVAYVYRTLKNLCTSDRRTELAQVHGGGARMESLDPEAPHARSMDDPEAELLERERRQLLAQAMAQLPPMMRRCVRLYVEDLPLAEIAARLAIRVGTVKAHLDHARKRLKELLGPGGGHDRI